MSILVNLPSIQEELLSCCIASCSSHATLVKCLAFLACMSEASFLFPPLLVEGWNKNVSQVGICLPIKLRERLIFGTMCGLRQAHHSLILFSKLRRTLNRGIIPIRKS